MKRIKCWLRGHDWAIDDISSLPVQGQYPLIVNTSHCTHCGCILQEMIVDSGR